MKIPSICQIALAAIFSILEQACSSRAHKNSLVSSPVKDDTTKYVYMNMNATNSRYFESEKAQPTTLTAEEKDFVQKYIATDCFKGDSSTTDIMIYHFFIDLQAYTRQYVPFIKNDGSKHVWVNAFRSTSHDEWRQQIVKVNDGGYGYLNFYVDLDRKVCYNMYVNGR